MAIYCTEAERHSYEESGYWRSLPELVPSVTFNTRQRHPDTDEYIWVDINTFDLFANKRVLFFSLPGAFTPTCSTFQLPDFEAMAQEFYDEGIDLICCISVNDSFVMNAWAKANNLKEILVVPDGSAKFTEQMNMMVDKDNLGFGRRSWRYACVVNNGKITDWFIEEGREDNCKNDPYMFTNPQFILNKLRGE
jgi:peroxiredoxin